MTYCTQKATKPPEKNLACSGVQCSLAGLILQHWCASIKRNFNIILIATQNENLFFNWPPMYIHTQEKKECFQLLSLETFQWGLSSLIYLTFLCKVSSPFAVLFLSVILVKYSCHFQCKLHLWSIRWPYIFINDFNRWLTVGVIKMVDKGKLRRTWAQQSQQ